VELLDIKVIIDNMQDEKTNTHDKGWINWDFGFNQSMPNYSPSLPLVKINFILDLSKVQENLNFIAVSLQDHQFFQLKDPKVIIDLE